MANIKFSQFTEKTTLGTVDFLVGYTGAENVQISPTNLLSTFVSGSGTNGQVAYFDPSNNLAGENDFFWDYTNNRLGIGTSSPSVKLNVVGTGTQLGTSGYYHNTFLKDDTNSGVLLGGNNTGNGVGFLAGINELALLTFGTSWGERMRITGSGNVGIGTTTPSSTLQISGTLDATGISQLGSSGANVYLTSSSAGNVGIGIAAPVAKLHVYQNNSDDDTTAGVTIEQDGTGDAALSFLLSTVRRWRLGIDNNDADKFKISDSTNLASSNRFTIDTSGNVGIGTSSPLANLDVANTAGSTYQRWSYDNPGANNYFLSLSETVTGGNVRFCFNQRNAGVNYNNALVFNQGNIGIGTDEPSSKLDVKSSGSNIDEISLTHSGNTAKIASLGQESGHGSLVLRNNSGIIKTRLNAAGNSSYILDSNLGIGTSSPGAKLQVNGTSKFLGNGAASLKWGDATEYATLTFDTNADPVIRAESGKSLKFDTNGANNVLTLNTSQNATFAGDIDVNGTASDIAFVGGSMNFKDSNDYPRLTRSGSSAQLGLFRSGSSAGGMYIGGNSTGFRIFTGSFSQRFHLDQSGNATFAGTVTAGSYFLGDDSSISLATTGAGTVFLRPNGQSTSGQMKVESTGNATFAGDVFIPSKLEHIGDSDTFLNFSDDNIVLSAGGASTTFAGNGNATFPGDIETTSSSKGLILKSPDGTRYRVTVANGGTLSVSAV